MYVDRNDHNGSAAACCSDLPDLGQGAGCSVRLVKRDHSEIIFVLATDFQIEQTNNLVQVTVMTEQLLRTEAESLIEALSQRMRYDGPYSSF